MKSMKKLSSLLLAALLLATCLPVQALAEDVPYDTYNYDYWENIVRIPAPYVPDGTISGGMIPKVDCCIEAIRRGVRRVFIIDGRVPHAVLIECLTDEGVGTMFTA